MDQRIQRLTPFQFGWYAFALPGYRPGDHTHTYDLYSYDDLPPIPEDRLTGKLQWLVPLDSDIDTIMQRYHPTVEQQAEWIPLWVNKLKNLVASAKQLGLSFPDTFLQLMASPELQYRIPSCTACYFSLSEKIVRCPGSEEGYLIRFLNDQQVCLLWYLYVTPKGEHCILVSPYLDEEMYLLDREEFIDLDGSIHLDEGLHFADPDESAAFVKSTYVCAPSFEAFLYRFWIENVLYFNLTKQKPLIEEQQQYLSYYTRRRDEH